MKRLKLFAQKLVKEEPRSWSRYPSSQSALPGGFVSAVMNAERFAGIGVSGWMPRRTEVIAEALYKQNVWNTGDQDAALNLSFTIPGMSASVLAGPSIGPEIGPFGDPGALVEAFFEVQVFSDDGTLIDILDVFDYSMVFEKLRGDGAYYFDVSDDLRADQGEPIFRRDGGRRRDRVRPRSRANGRS